MKIGVSGHQDRPGIKWDWVRNQLDRLFREWATPLEGWSSLAAGADQVFAEAIFAAGFRHTAVIPFDGYSEVFNGAESRANYELLLKKSEVVELKLNDVPREMAYLEAGRSIVDATDTMIFVWDGEEAGGLGGTADVVAYANLRHKPVRILDPIACVQKGDWT